MRPIAVNRTAPEANFVYVNIKANKARAHASATTILAAGAIEVLQEKQLTANTITIKYEARCQLPCIQRDVNIGRSALSR